MDAKEYDEARRKSLQPLCDEFFAMMEKTRQNFAEGLAEDLEKHMSKEDAGKLSEELWQTLTFTVPPMRVGTQIE